MKSSRLYRVVFSLLPAVMVFAGAELSLRALHFHFQRSLGYMQFAYPAPSELHQVFLQDPALLWRMKPGYDFGLGFPKLNRQGFRGLEVSAAKPPDGFRIACLGDSVTFGLPQADYPSLLQARLAGRFSGREIEVYNFGVPGYSSLQGLRLLDQEVLRAQPDAVAIFYGWNDHWLVKSFSDHQQRVKQNPWLFQLRDRLARLRTYQALNLVLSRLRPAGGENKLRVPPEQYRENLVAMLRACRGRGAVPILATAPAGFGLGRLPDFFVSLGFIEHDADLAPLHHRYNQIVRQVGREENAPVADLEAVFQERGVNIFFEHPDQDIIHPNQKGQELIAETLAELIASDPELFPKP